MSQPGGIVTAKQEQDAVDLVSVDASNPLTTNRLWQRSRAVLSDWLGVIGVVSFFAAWELGTRFEILNPVLFPAVQQDSSQRFRALRQWLHLGAHVVQPDQLRRRFFSFGVLGVMLGVPMGWYKNVAKTFDPLLSGIYATPFDRFLAADHHDVRARRYLKNHHDDLGRGVSDHDQYHGRHRQHRYRLITMARAFGAKDNQIFLKVSLPGSLPYLVAGMRVALGRALVYIVVAEQYGAATGLGYLSSVAAQRFQMAAMFVPILIIAGLGAGLNELSNPSSGVWKNGSRKNNFVIVA